MQSALAFRVTVAQNARPAYLTALSTSTQLVHEPLVTRHVRHLEGYVVSHRSIREKLDSNPSIPRRQPITEPKLRVSLSNFNLKRGKSLAEDLTHW